MTTDAPRCAVDGCSNRAGSHDWPDTCDPQTGEPFKLCDDCWRVNFGRNVNNVAYQTTSLDGVLSPRALIGVQPDGKRAVGAYPWWWCWGNQPVHVKGAMYADSNEASHLVKCRSEDEAARIYLDSVLSDPLSTEESLEAAKAAMSARKRRGLRGYQRRG